MVYEKQCLQCGQKHISKNNNSKFCSKNCTARYYGSLSKKHRVCKRCGETFWTPDASKKRSMYCLECAEKNANERAVARERKHIVYKKECIICKKVFETRRKNTSICGDSCRKKYECQRARVYDKDKHLNVECTCLYCGNKFVPEYGNKRRTFCCEEHNHLYEDPVLRKKRRKEYNKKRSEQMKKAFVEPVYIKTLYKRANGICGICGRLIEFDKSATNTWGLTIDHIVPLSKGGKHCMDNCQIAHRICNSYKLDKSEFHIDWEELETVPRKERFAHLSRQNP